MSDQTQFLDKDGFYKIRDALIEKNIGIIFELWKNFLSAQNESLEFQKDYFIHKRNLFEAIERVDKRKVYYYVFHRIENICEYKEIAILCYWINTLKPFMVINENSRIYNSPNELFSLYIIISVIAGIYKERNPKKEFKTPDDKTIKDYVYNFKYCDLSREAMIFFVETLAKSYGIGMETNKKE